MEELVLHTGRQTSKILLGETIGNLSRYLPEKGKTIVVTDKNVYAHYRKELSAWPVIVISPGEKHKTLSAIDRIIGELIKHEADRTSFLVGVGGGIVCDIAGFAASVFMRGIRFGFVSTTLLSQVDASVGGKNGVNYKGYKNMVGVFNQPVFVICDFAMLKTLPRREFVAGMAEIIKHGAIKSRTYFDYIEENYSKALRYDAGVIERLVKESVLIKAAVVEADEREAGERRKLNFGHTTAHAIEKITSAYHHGEAVAIGMVVAAHLSVKKGLLPAAEAQRLSSLIERTGLPVSLKGINKKKLFDAFRKDKKRDQEVIHFVLLKQLGEAVIEEITLNELEQQLYDLC